MLINEENVSKYPELFGKFRIFSNRKSDTWKSETSNKIFLTVKEANIIGVRVISTNCPLDKIDMDDKDHIFIGLFPNGVLKLINTEGYDCARYFEDCEIKNG